MDHATHAGRRHNGIEPQADHYDVVIIGSGAGGGSLARALADSGHSILILERGGWLPNIVNTRRVRKCNQAAAIKARKERLTAFRKSL